MCSVRSPVAGCADGRRCLGKLGLGVASAHISLLYQVGVVNKLLSLCDAHVANSVWTLTLVWWRGHSHLAVSSNAHT